MVREFEGKTEKEAIDNAVTALGLERDEFDVEIVESHSGFLFKKGKVKIRVHVVDEDGVEVPLEPKDDLEEQLIEFLETVLQKMGYPGKVSILSREGNKISFGIESEYSNILIGRKGKNLDALQLLANVFVGKMSGNDLRVIIDTENYRYRREETLIRLATKIADQVRRTKKSRLLEPMNPFERRLIHTTLNDMDDIETKSEGEGLYKQVRIMYKGKNRKSV